MKPGRRSSRFGALLLLAPLLMAQTKPVLVPDVSQRDIEIAYSFTGAELLLFGAILYPGGRVPAERDADIVVVVKGPSQSILVREKSVQTAAAKDLFLSGTGSTVTLSAANTTRFYRLSAAQLAAGFYSSPTVNAPATVLYLNPTLALADVGAIAPNDVFAVKVRGAEVMLLRILSVRPGTAGASARVRFEYRSQ